MRVIVPNTIGSITSSTVAEPSAGETAWVSAGSYTAGDVRIRTTTHKKYMALSTHSGRTALPESDPMYWKDIGATDRWKMFDSYTSTQTATTTTMTVVFQPGFFNAVALYNLTGASITLTVKDQPGGTTIFSYTGNLFEPFPDWYEWLFSPYADLKKLVFQDIIPYATAEVTIAVTAVSGAPVGIGMVVCGDMRGFTDGATFGGTQYGAKVEPVDYSYIKTNEYGETEIVKRKATTDLNASVIMPKENADYAVNLLQEVLAVPAAWIATDSAGYASLSVFGLGSGSVEHVGPNIAQAQITVKGLI